MRDRITMPALLATTLAMGCGGHHATTTEPAAPAEREARFVADGDWATLATEPYKGKQDDIYFVDAAHGYYGNGSGKLFHTSDGGATWTKVWEHPGTYIRAIGFLDDQRGFIGNLGPDYFPGVEDTTMLYRTDDGGKTVTPVQLPDTDGARGVCSIDVLSVDFINAGHRDHKEIIHVGGRVGGPPSLYGSDDGGASWQRVALPPEVAMILDVKFLDTSTGFVFAGSNADVEQSHGLIIKTTDSGRHWKVVYESTRPFELIWKGAFVTSRVGYATLQSYDPDPKMSQRYVVQTTDAGETWKELPLVDDHEVDTFGVGFVDQAHGWIGGVPHGFATDDGGVTWKADPGLGLATNKIRIVKAGDDRVVFGIGLDVVKRTFHALPPVETN